MDIHEQSRVFRHTGARVALGAGCLLLLATAAGHQTAGRYAALADSAASANRRVLFTSDAQVLLINEVLPNPDAEGDEAAWEWVELVNPGAQEVSLAGWRVEDNRGSEILPDSVLAPGDFMVVAAGPGFMLANPDYEGKLIELDGQIGNGLGNTGDRVRMLDPLGAEVDVMSYGSDRTAFDPAPAAPDEGRSLERAPDAADTDSAADWIERDSPTPGSPGGGGSPVPPAPSPPPVISPTPAFTITPAATGTGVGGSATRTSLAGTTEAANSTRTATPTVTATDSPRTPETLGRAVLNEFLPAPRTVDWDQDGRIDGGDEWVEIANASDVEIDLSGWHLDDIDPGGSPPFVFPDGTILAPNGYLVLFGSQSRLQLNNGGDTVSLRSPEGAVRDTVSFGAVQADRSVARSPDKVGPWTDLLEPSPGAANRGGVPVGTATMSSPGSAVHFPLLISEVLYDGPSSGNDYLEEWVEIHNRSPSPVSLAGWFIADAVSSDAIGTATVPALGFRIVSPSPVEGGATVADGRIGNGLSNRGDLVQLISPDGQVADAMSYGSNLDALNPAVSLGPPGSSLERIPHFVDTDSSLDWWTQPVPSPGLPGDRPDEVPAVVINELCPDPRRVDWDSSGQASYEDEWIELFNASDKPVRLAGWSLVVGTDRFRAAIPATVLEARAHLVLYRRTSGLYMNGSAESLSLVRPDAVVADTFAWTEGPGADRVWGRATDGRLPWSSDLEPSPGAPNRVLGPRLDREEPRRDGATVLAQLADLWAVPFGRTVAVSGAVAAPIGLFGRRAFYMIDHSSGVRVQLTGRAALPPLATGDKITVTGRLDTSFGERQLNARPNDVIAIGGAAALVAVPARTGGLEGVVGRLVRIAGRVERWESLSVYVDDGSGPARVFYRRETGLRRPFVNRGQWLDTAGIVSRYATDPESEGGYRIMPRGLDDVGGPDASGAWPSLPATGGPTAYRASSSRSSVSPP